MISEVTNYHSKDISHSNDEERISFHIDLEI